MNDVYIPGVCNIGPTERRMRRNIGIAGLVVTLAALIAFMIYTVEPVWRLLIFLPATMAAVGFLQAQLHFCVRFGMSGLFNFSDDLAKHETIDQAEFRRKDQHKALVIIGGSVAAGIIVTLASLLI